MEDIIKSHVDNYFHCCDKEVFVCNLPMLWFRYNFEMYWKLWKLWKKQLITNYILWPETRRSTVLRMNERVFKKYTRLINILNVKPSAGHKAFKHSILDDNTLHKHLHQAIHSTKKKSVPPLWHTSTKNLLAILCCTLKI